MRATDLRPAAALSAATLLIWTTRIRNIWTDDELDTAGQVGRTALALAFTAFAVATLVTWWRARRTGDVPDAAARLVRAFAVWTVAVWVVRAVQIALADHAVGFVVVHTVLAIVSIGLALWADRRAHARGAGDAPRPRDLSSSR
ncbi:MAG TPA: hypothetical protein VFV42_03830 [Acidimicrobiales bacterium]|nr:hypothetical protein [Acidimicrobiales bacterium]